MTGLFVVLGCTIIFFLLAQILTPSSIYNPNNDLQRVKCYNKLEKRVYDALRFKGYYPTVQYKVPNKRFKLDFAFFSLNGLKIDVEIDGPFHRTPEGIKRDRNRDKYMKTNGWKVIRITDIALNNGFEKQILLLVATLNKLGIEPSKESDFVLLEQEQRRMM
ncbi:endonuclease domain-containing protein [Bacillus wiedmannii]|uniref:endonuclease domain-containing protein n=1 Tax=Bacillus wiedmannii TaxID=1890302 RepID=UPI003CEEE824